MIIKILLGLQLAFLPYTYAAGDSATLTMENGKSGQVQLLRSTDTQVTFKSLKNRQVTTLNLDKLDASSRKTIEEWKKAGGGASIEYDIDFVSGKSNRKSANEDYDDRRLVLKPKITISNKDRNTPTKKATMTVLILGRPVDDRNAIFILGKEIQKIDPIQPLEKTVATLEPVISEYDNKGSAQFGSKYLGYAVLIHEGNSTLLAAKSVPKTMVDNYGLMLLKLEVAKRYDKGLKLIPPNNTTRY